MSDDTLRQLQATQVKILENQAGTSGVLRTVADQVAELRQVVVVGTEGRRSLVSRVDIVETRLQAQLPSLRPPRRAQWKAALAIGGGLIAALTGGTALGALF